MRDAGYYQSFDRDRQGVEAAGIIDQVKQALGAARFGLFNGTPPNPSETAVRAGVEALNSSACDGIIAVGGGSSIDLAKTVAVSARHAGPLRQFALIEGGALKITAATLPIIAVPTTAGTGSESRARRHHHPGRRAQGRHPLASCDSQGRHLRPEPDPGLASRFDSCHWHGCDCALHRDLSGARLQPPADGIALDGLWRAWRHIEVAFRDPADVEARTNMMSASLQGALAFQRAWAAYTASATHWAASTPSCTTAPSTPSCCRP